MNDMNWIAVRPEIVLLAMSCLIAIADLFVGVAQHRLPARREPHPVGGRVPVPHADVGSRRGKRVALLRHRERGTRRLPRQLRRAQRLEEILSQPCHRLRMRALVMQARRVGVVLARPHSEGLQVGDRIIVEGLHKIAPGAPVKPVPISAAKA